MWPYVMLLTQQQDSLEDYARIQQGKVKTHELQSTGTVIRLVPEKDHGFIEAIDGHEVCFHRNSVTGSGFDTLRTGDEIRYIEEKDDLGLQTSIVYL
jgi:cold shock CspA family protein